MNIVKKIYKSRCAIIKMNLKHCKKIEKSEIVVVASGALTDSNDFDDNNNNKLAGSFVGER